MHLTDILNWRVMDLAKYINSRVRVSFSYFVLCYFLPNTCNFGCTDYNSFNSLEPKLNAGRKLQTYGLIIAICPIRQKLDTTQLYNLNSILTVVKIKCYGFDHSARIKSFTDFYWSHISMLST